MGTTPSRRKPPLTALRTEILSIENPIDLNNTRRPDVSTELRARPMGTCRVPTATRLSGSLPEKLRQGYRRCDLIA